MKKLERRDLSKHLSKAALSIYDESDLTVRQHDDGTLRVAVFDSEVIGDGWDFNALEAFFLESYLADKWGAIVNLMDDDTREAVHRELAPCENVAFLDRYLQLDPDFAGILQSEFSIDRDPGLSDDQLDAARTAKAIRSQDTWDPDLCAHLCDLAGLSEEWREANYLAFERVIEQAADKLNVRIYKRPYWYAVMRNRDDSDFGYGSHSIVEAKKMLKKMRDDSPEAYIAVVEEGNDPICVDEIRDVEDDAETEAQNDP